MKRELLAECSIVERIVSAKPADDGSDNTMYFCKWQGLPYSECTWEIDTDIASKCQDEVLFRPPECFGHLSLSTD